MGHSWGGLVACHVAAAAPDRISALVLLDSGHLDYRDQPGFDPGKPLEAWIQEASARQWSWPSRDAFLADLREDAKRMTPEYEEAVLAGMVEGFDGSVHGAPPEVRGAVYSAAARARSTDAWPAIDAARIPTLLVYATDPPEQGAVNVAAAERLRAAIGTATVVALPGAAHDLIGDAGPELAAIVADWLDSKD